MTELMPFMTPQNDQEPPQGGFWTWAAVIVIVVIAFLTIWAMSKS